jgi:hypothetical protein
VVRKDLIKSLPLVLILIASVIFAVFIRPTHDGKMTDEILPFTLVGSLSVSESELIGISFSSLLKEKIEYGVLRYNIDEFIKMEKILDDYSIVLHESKSDRKFRVYTKDGLVAKVELLP